MRRAAGSVAVAGVLAALLSGCGGDSDATDACRKDREAILKSGGDGLAISTAPACADVDYTEQLRMSRELADKLKKG